MVRLRRTAPSLGRVMSGFYLSRRVMVAHRGAIGAVIDEEVSLEVPLKRALVLGHTVEDWVLPNIVVTP